jgi:exonuclease III
MRIATLAETAASDAGWIVGGDLNVGPEDRDVWDAAEVQARKAKMGPSDHASVLVDIDAPGAPLDAGWEGALERIAARTRKSSRQRSSG